MINGIVLKKLESLEEILAELKSLGKISTQQLQDDWRTYRAVERDLQVLVEIVIDICQRIISLAGKTPASTAGEAVERCIKMGAISSFEPYRRMVQFRNFIVHRYEKVDQEILIDIVNRRLSDFEKFRDEILTYAKG